MYADGCTSGGGFCRFFSSFAPSLAYFLAPYFLPASGTHTIWHRAAASQSCASTYLALGLHALLAETPQKPTFFFVASLPLLRSHPILPVCLQASCLPSSFLRSPGRSTSVLCLCDSVLAFYLATRHWETSPAARSFGLLFCLLPCLRLEML